MKKFILLFIALFLFLINKTDAQVHAPGSLVIVGGGLEPSNKSIFNQLIALAGGAEKATFAIIPSASATPVQSYVYFRNILISYGLKPDNIFLVPVALMDDDSTKDVNESEWNDNGNDPRVAELVRKCSAVWFSGGDQLRTMKALQRPDGSRTLVLDAVWDVYRSGGVIGGTSAGAAIMSEPMIGGGTSLAALIHGVIRDYTGNDFPETQGALVTKGLGFFPHGLVDQHFNARARIGRLAIVLMNTPNGENLGFGIDENTALIYDGKQNRMHVAGVAGVTILNTSKARISYFQKLPMIGNLTISYLEEGDGYDFSTGIVTPADGKLPTTGKERHSGRYPGQDGILSPNPANFRDLISICLVDNKETDNIQNITWISQDTGFQVSLYKTAESEGFYSEKPSQSNRYTVTRIRMDITPVHVTVTPLK